MEHTEYYSLIELIRQEYEVIAHDAIKNGNPNSIRLPLPRYRDADSMMMKIIRRTYIADATFLHGRLIKKNICVSAFMREFSLPPTHYTGLLKYVSTIDGMLDDIIYNAAQETGVYETLHMDASWLRKIDGSFDHLNKVYTSEDGCVLFVGDRSYNDWYEWYFGVPKNPLSIASEKARELVTKAVHEYKRNSSVFK